MTGRECIPRVALNSLSAHAQHLFAAFHGRSSTDLRSHYGSIDEVHELVEAGYARIISNGLSLDNRRVRMVDLHENFGLAVGSSGTQDVTVEIMSPEQPDHGAGTLLAVINECELSMLRGEPWDIARVIAVDRDLTDDGESIRTAALTIGNPMLARSYGAHRQVWLGTLVKAHLYPAGSDLATASLTGDPSLGGHRFTPPEIISVIPSVVRLMVKPSKSFLAEPK